MLKKIKSKFLIINIFDFLCLKKELILIKKSNYFKKILEKNDFNYYKLYNEINKIKSYYEKIDLLLYYSYFLKNYKNNKISEEKIKYFLFRFIRDLKSIYIEQRNEFTLECLNYLENCSNDIKIKCFNSKINFPEINNKINEIGIYLKFIENDKKKTNNTNFIKNIFEKIKNKNSVKKIFFRENLNLNEIEYENFYFDLCNYFPNANINIKIDYFNDMEYFQLLQKFNEIKIVFNNKIGEEKNKFNKILIEKKIENLILDFRKNEIEILEYFLNYNNNNIKELTLINFIYKEKKEYFFNLNKIEKFYIYQRFYDLHLFPILISTKIKTLKEIYFEKVKIREENLIEILNNNPLLEVFKFEKNYNIKFKKNLAECLNKLKYLKRLYTDHFDNPPKIININNKKIIKNDLTTINEFYLYLKSNSIIDLNLSDEGNVDLNILINNLPNLFNLSIENVNIYYDKNKNKKKIFNIYSLELNRTTNEFEFVEDLIQQNKLEEFCYDSIEINSYKKLINIIKNFKNLQKLRLIYNTFDKIDENDINLLLNEIKELKNLDELNFSVFRISEKINENIVNCIKELKNLNELNIKIENKSSEELKNDLEMKIKSINKKLIYKIKYLNE